jgi:hypothetical protein
MATGQAPATAMTHGESAGHARDEGAD